jgi:AcrR family transcriptional regulator
MRDARRTKENILAAAELEFSEKGLAGARIDEIARNASVNKRMLYEYFGNKEDLYKAVLAHVLGRIGEREASVLREGASGASAIRRLIRFYFEFLRDNPSYVNLLLWENLNEGRHIRLLEYGAERGRNFQLLKDIIAAGVRDGVFRAGIDPEEAILALLTYPFCYFSNRYTLSRLLSRDLGEGNILETYIETTTEMFLRYLCAGENKYEETTNHVD